jgi:hypothetical protein
MSYKTIIGAIQNWHNLTGDQVADALTAKTVDYSDPDRWSLLGIALIIGPQNVTAFCDFCTEIGYSWIPSQAAGSGLPIGDDAFNAQLLATQHPLCIAIANYGKRKISLCELNKLAEDRQAIIANHAAMKLELKQNEVRSAGANRWNAFSKAVQAWDGNPSTEPQL